MKAGSAAPRAYAVLGNPIAHSLSPAIQGAALREAGLDAAYVALQVSAGELEAVMRALGRRGGGNVTLPHKGRAAGIVDRPSEAVRRTGACNCFWGDGEGRLAGENTDVAAFREAAEALLGGGLAGARVLLLGSGGAARAVAAACWQARAASIEVRNRTPSRAEALVAAAPADARDRCRVLEPDVRPEGPYDLAVNATSLGLEPGGPLPLRLEGFRVGAALDLVYGPGGTPWVRHARERGVPAEDGLEMLVRQAAASFRCWFGREPSLETMRSAAREATAAGSPRGRPAAGDEA